MRQEQQEPKEPGLAIRGLVSLRTTPRTHASFTPRLLRFPRDSFVWFAVVFLPAWIPPASVGSHAHLPADTSGSGERRPEVQALVPEAPSVSQIHASTVSHKQTEHTFGTEDLPTCFSWSCRGHKTSPVTSAPRPHPLGRRPAPRGETEERAREEWHVEVTLCNVSLLPGRSFIATLPLMSTFTRT